MCVSLTLPAVTDCPLPAVSRFLWSFNMCVSLTLPAVTDCPLPAVSRFSWKHSICVCPWLSLLSHTVLYQLYLDSHENIQYVCAPDSPCCHRLSFTSCISILMKTFNMCVPLTLPAVTHCPLPAVSRFSWKHSICVCPWLSLLSQTVLYQLYLDSHENIQYVCVPGSPCCHTLSFTSCISTLMKTFKYMCFPGSPCCHTLSFTSCISILMKTFNMCVSLTLPAVTDYPLPAVSRFLWKHSICVCPWLSLLSQTVLYQLYLDSYEHSICVCPWLSLLSQTVLYQLYLDSHENIQYVCAPDSPCCHRLSFTSCISTLMKTFNMCVSLTLPAVTHCPLPAVSRFSWKHSICVCPWLSLLSHTVLYQLYLDSHENIQIYVCPWLSLLSHTVLYQLYLDSHENIQYVCAPDSPCCHRLSFTSCISILMKTFNMCVSLALPAVTHCPLPAVSRLSWKHSICVCSWLSLLSQTVLYQLYLDSYENIQYVCVPDSPCCHRLSFTSCILTLMKTFNMCVPLTLPAVTHCPLSAVSRFSWKHSICVCPWLSLLSQTVLYQLYLDSHENIQYVCAPDSPCCHTLSFTSCISILMKTFNMCVPLTLPAVTDCPLPAVSRLSWKHSICVCPWLSLLSHTVLYQLYLDSHENIQIYVFPWLPCCHTLSFTSCISILMKTFNMCVSLTLPAVTDYPLPAVSRFLWKHSICVCPWLSLLSQTVLYQLYLDSYDHSICVCPWLSLLSQTVLYQLYLDSHENIQYVCAPDSPCCHRLSFTSCISTLMKTFNMCVSLTLPAVTHCPLPAVSRFSWKHSICVCPWLSLLSQTVLYQLYLDSYENIQYVCVPDSPCCHRLSFTSCISILMKTFNICVPLTLPAVTDCPLPAVSRFSWKYSICVCPWLSLLSHTVLYQLYLDSDENIQYVCVPDSPCCHRLSFTSSISILMKTFNMCVSLTLPAVTDCPLPAVSRFLWKHSIFVCPWLSLLSHTVLYQLYLDSHENIQYVCAPDSPCCHRLSFTSCISILMKTFNMCVFLALPAVTDCPLPAVSRFSWKHSICVCPWLSLLSWIQPSLLLYPFLSHLLLLTLFISISMLSYMQLQFLLSHLFPKIISNFSSVIISHKAYFGRMDKLDPTCGSLRNKTLNGLRPVNVVLCRLIIDVPLNKLQAFWSSFGN